MMAVLARAYSPATWASSLPKDQKTLRDGSASCTRARTSSSCLALAHAWSRLTAMASHPSSSTSLRMASITSSRDSGTTTSPR